MWSSSSHGWPAGPGDKATPAKSCDEPSSANADRSNVAPTFSSEVVDGRLAPESPFPIHRSGSRCENARESCGLDDSTLRRERGAQLSPIFPPSQHLLGTVGTRRDPDGLGRSRSGSVGDPATEIRPHCRDGEMVPEALSLLGDAPSPASQPREIMTQSSLSMVDGKEGVGMVPPSRR